MRDLEKEKKTSQQYKKMESRTENIRDTVWTLNLKIHT